MIPLLLIGAVLLFLVGVYWTHASPYSQLFGTFRYQARTSEKVIALTFDDGPNEPFTSQLLDVLKSEKVVATFFVVGKAVENYPEVTKRIAREGHTVGNHSYSHKFISYLAHPFFEQELLHTQAALADAIGKKPALFRPPWLYRQPALLHTVRSQGLTPISGVFCHPLEVAQINARAIAKTAIRRAAPGRILIFHDGKDGQQGNRTQTVEAVRLSIQALKKQNYRFVTVDQLLGLKPYL